MQHVAASVEAWVQQCALLVRSGYVFASTGVIPHPKIPEDIDRKLITLYGAGVSRSTRVRDKRRGVARVQYLRYQRFFALLATHGQSPFFEREAGNIKDVRESLVRFFGYSISYRKGRDGRLHSSVRIELRELRRMKAEYLAHWDRPLSWWRWKFATFPFEPWAPVVRQVHVLRRAVNRKRKEKNMPEIPKDFVRYVRRSVKVFEP